MEKSTKGLQILERKCGLQLLSYFKITLKAAFNTPALRDLQSRSCILLLLLRKIIAKTPARTL